MISIYWLIAGAIMLAFEAFGFPGIGFLFGGAGAIVTGILVELGAIGAGDYLLQGAVFLLATTLFALLLWNKVKSWRLDPDAKTYSNMVGKEAEVLEPVSWQSGTVRWSGTLMQARLPRDEAISSASAPALAAGTRVTIVEVRGNILVVTPQP